MSKIRILISALICLGFLYAAAARPAEAAGNLPPTFNAGFKLLLGWNEEENSGVEFMLWYPTTKAESRVGLGPWAVYGAQDAKPVEGKFPLLIISHDTGANKFSYHDTAAQLAAAGFVVAAPTHRGDSSNDMSDIYTANQIFGRVKEIHLIVNYLDSSEYKNLADTSRIGILGIGSGAATALILAGGLVDVSGYSRYCNEAEAGNDLCSPWVKQRLTTLAFYLPQPPDTALPGVKAMALAAPGLGMLFTKDSLAGIKAEVCIYDAEREPYDQAGMLRDMLPSHQKYVALPGLDSRDLTAPCTEALLGEPTWQCDPVPEDSQELRESLFNTGLIKFFAQQLSPSEPN